MIRYPYDEEAIAAEIRQADPNWFDKASKRTRAFVKAGRFEEKSSIWSKVKPAYMRLQMNKCIFCERQFENPDYGTIEFDVEHFRPKSSVLAWPDAVRHPLLQYGFETGTPAPSGYYWLAYELLNYAASCKVCNTTFKLNYFPVAAERGTSSATVPDLAAEKPFLCYPIGTVDDDPEDLVTFIATTAVPTARSGHAARRGRLIIDFFGLNEREQLHRQRAQMIALFGPALSAASNGTATASDQQLIDRMESSMLPHAGCLRAFKRLWDEDVPIARRAFEQCRMFMTSDAGTAPPAG